MGVCLPVAFSRSLILAAMVPFSYSSFFMRRRKIAPTIRKKIMILASKRKRGATVKIILLHHHYQQQVKKHSNARHNSRNTSDALAARPWGRCWPGAGIISSNGWSTKCTSFLTATWYWQVRPTWQRPAPTVADRTTMLAWARSFAVQMPIVPTELHWGITMGCTTLVYVFSLNGPLMQRMTRWGRRRKLVVVVGQQHWAHLTLLHGMMLEKTTT